MWRCRVVLHAPALDLGVLPLSVLLRSWLVAACAPPPACSGAPATVPAACRSMLPLARGSCRTRCCATLAASCAGCTQLPAAPLACTPPTTQQQLACAASASAPTHLAPRPALPAGFGGMLCEGTLQNLTLSGASSSATKSLTPGAWDFYIVDLNGSNFNFK
jgi:hypothetical protein